MARTAWRPFERLWQIAPADPHAETLARQGRLPPLVATVLAMRGAYTPESAQAFLDPKLSDLHDPADLPGAEQAAERLAEAVRQGRKIVIYGDYDVDGITAVAILHAAIGLVGGQVGFYIPHRIEEGYGLNPAAVAEVAAAGGELMVTVDCGISAAAELADLPAGLEAIVTDHHALPEQLPPAGAIVHPHLGEYPNRHLCGAGVALKVAWALARRVCGTERVDDRLREFLLYATSLAAMGTIADVVPLRGENRVLASYGLRGLAGAGHPGLAALIASAGLDGKSLQAKDVGFVLGPRLNAAGRMGHANLAVELLTDADAARGAEIAAELNKLNAQRQKVERQITAEAEALVREGGLDDPSRRTIVLAGEHWHGGVIGIVASRLVGTFNRPVLLVAANGDGLGHGSGRSIPGFDFHAALTACSEHLVGFGGHAMAGGCRVELQKVQALAEAFEGHAQARGEPVAEAAPLAIDAEAKLAQLSYPTVSQLARMAPFGEGNPAPVFAIRRCQVATPPKRMGRGGNAVAMTLAQGATHMRAVGFGMGDLADALAGVKEVDIAAAPTLNTFRGRTSVELHLCDVVWK